jgi:holliday junction DNA helicase RuvB
MSPGARREVLVDATTSDPDPAPVVPDEAEEAGLRPRTLHEFVGQGQLVEHLRIVLDAAV